jgi:hypothetical protein
MNAPPEQTRTPLHGRLFISGGDVFRGETKSQDPQVALPFEDGVFATLPQSIFRQHQEANSEKAGLKLDPVLLPRLG